MFSIENVMDLGGLAGSAVSILQSQNIHNVEVLEAKRRHNETLALATAQHEKDMKVAKQTYLMSAFTSLEQHFQQLNADLISSSKESESDMFDQRNQCFQTVILSATIMFSSLVTVIFQGFLPKNAGQFLFVSYALSSASAFAFLFLSIVLCVEVLLRASSFMYNRATNHTTQLREAILKTKMMMKKIRVGEAEAPEVLWEDARTTKDHSHPGKTGYVDGENNSKSNVTRTEFFRDSLDVRKDEVAFQKHYEGSRQIAGMEEHELQSEWERHEAEVHRYLEEREKINDQTSVLVSADADSSRMSFEQFWRESCKLWGDIAILFFYAGTANLLLAIMIYMWSEFFINYQNAIGAIIAVLVIGISIIVGIALYFFLRQNNNRTSKKSKRIKVTGKVAAKGGWDKKVKSMPLLVERSSLDLDPTLL